MKSNNYKKYDLEERTFAKDVETNESLSKKDLIMRVKIRKKE
jgi:hypothetical protein